MSEETKVDKDYKEAFNLGYELAKELNLKSPMFKDLNVENNRMTAMQAGMVEYSNGIAQVKNKGIDPPLGLDSKKNTSKNIDPSKDCGNDEGKGLNLSK